MADRAKPGGRTRQCKACPWKVSTVPDVDIPDGYDVNLHAALAERTIAEPGSIAAVIADDPLYVMACHETARDVPQPCVGWVMNQLGPGNNIQLRIRAMDGRYKDFRTVGPQHGRFEDTLPRCST